MTTTDSNKKASLNIIVLYSAGHLGSAIVMNKLLAMPEVNIVGVVKAQTIHLSLGQRKKVQKHFNNLGWKFAWLLIWQRIMQSIGFMITLLLPSFKKHLKPAWKIASDHNIPVFHCKNINDNDTLRFIESLQADLLISAYFSQILKAAVLKIPKLGTLNLHPGWLPSYKGVMAYFWVLKNNTNKGGVSVHWIDEGIDTGELLARRSFTLNENSTQDTVLHFTAIIGSNLLRRVFRELLKGNKPKKVLLKENELDNYYAMPKAEDFESYIKRRRFFRIRDTLGFYLSRRL